MTKLVALAALFAAGLVLAGTVASVGVADITTTETLPVTTTVEQTTTAPAETVVTTVERTTTQEATTTPTVTGTTTSSGASSSTPTWVWIVLAILAAAVIGLCVALLSRRGSGLPDGERQRRLEAAVASWTAQGWALENQTPGSAILRHGPDLMVVSIDEKGQISTRPLDR